MNLIEQKIHDRDVLLGVLVAEDRWARAALDRRDDMALLRRVAKAGLTLALPLAFERAWMRGAGDAIQKALDLSNDEMAAMVAAVYARVGDVEYPH